MFISVSSRTRQEPKKQILHLAPQKMITPFSNNYINLIKLMYICITGKIIILKFNRMHYGNH